VNIEASAVRKLRGYFLIKMGKLRHLMNLLQIARESWSEHWPHVGEVQDRILDKQKKIVASILEFGCKTGEPRVRNVKSAVHLMAVSLQSIEFRWIFDTLDVLFRYTLSICSM
jgi:hypothetical protein